MCQKKCLLCLPINSVKYHTDSEIIILSANFEKSIPGRFLEPLVSDRTVIDQSCRCICRSTVSVPSAKKPRSCLIKSLEAGFASRLDDWIFLYNCGLEFLSKPSRKLLPEESIRLKVPARIWNVIFFLRKQTSSGVTILRGILSIPAELLSSRQWILLHPPPLPTPELMTFSGLDFRRSCQAFLARTYSLLKCHDQPSEIVPLESSVGPPRLWSGKNWESSIGYLEATKLSIIALEQLR